MREMILSNVDFPALGFPNRAINPALLAVIAAAKKQHFNFSAFGLPAILQFSPPLVSSKGALVKYRIA